MRKVPIDQLMLLDARDLHVAQSGAELALSLALLEVHHQQILRNGQPSVGVTGPSTTGDTVESITLPCSLKILTGPNSFRNFDRNWRDQLSFLAIEEFDIHKDLYRKDLYEFCEAFSRALTSTS